MPAPSLGTDPYDVTYATTGKTSEYMRHKLITFGFQVIAYACSVHSAIKKNRHKKQMLKPQ
jgi:hypothetical protein